jgi:hypothetical protein
MENTPESPWRNVDEAAAHLRSAKATLDKLRVTGGGPVYTKMGKRVIYRVDDLDAWAASKRRESTSDNTETAHAA